MRCIVNQKNSVNDWQRTTRRGQSLLAAAAIKPSRAVSTMTPPTAMANSDGLVRTSWIDS